MGLSHFTYSQHSMTAKHSSQLSLTDQMLAGVQKKWKNIMLLYPRLNKSFWTKKQLNLGDNHTRHSMEYLATDRHVILMQT